MAKKTPKGGDGIGIKTPTKKAVKAKGGHSENGGKTPAKSDYLKEAERKWKESPAGKLDAVLKKRGALPAQQVTATIFTNGVHGHSFSLHFAKGMAGTVELKPKKDGTYTLGFTVAKWLKEEIEKAGFKLTERKKLVTKRVLFEQRMNEANQISGEEADAMAEEILSGNGFNPKPAPRPKLKVVHH